MSIRKKLLVNINQSKNTRMDVSIDSIKGGWKTDILTHMSRYDKIASLMISESKRLGRPITILDLGCGELWPLRVLLVAYWVKKSEVVSKFTGYDIDPACLKEHKYWPNSGGAINDSKWLKLFNGEVRIQDLTVEPELDIPDSSIDFFYCTEVIEHMKPEFVEPWLSDVCRTMRSGGLAYISTPNSDGSNKKLPKDHVYEWGYDELWDLFELYFDVESVVGTFAKMPSINKAQKEYLAGDREEGWEDWQVKLIEERFGNQWRRVILAVPYPDVANNCAWMLRKQ
ncbi:hypothetical protein LCGC14_0506790 [marine sediment metagenome]|uniref:Methyltransferase type 11 domain-containing protein n=1 Tax=marine sediment metagenome TaxID=412755 RepID=A0A0F9S7D4_9ZZZZ